MVNEPHDMSGLSAEERRIYARVSRRGFMGATAGATLAALAGREPELVTAAQAPGWRKPKRSTRSAIRRSSQA
jgi:hypothetical protein